MNEKEDKMRYMIGNVPIQVPDDDSRWVNDPRISNGQYYAKRGNESCILMNKSWQSNDWRLGYKANTTKPVAKFICMREIEGGRE